MERLKQLGLTLGALGPWGVFLAAALDSFIPLPQLVDTMVVVFSYQTGRPALYALAAVVGSTLGTAALYGLGRSGARLARLEGASQETVRRLPAWLRRNDFLLVAVAGILPPPFPFKAVVIPAGMARLAPLRFVSAVALSRAFRYGLEAWLAASYGHHVLTFMRENYPAVALALAALLVCTAIVLHRRWALARAAK
jgi:membrane protein YqaA with SNARE-associated domain